jgi:glycosyltransferase involved in cell wall biosynthesis
MVDRLWRPDISLDRARRLADRVSASGAALIVCLDDNLLDLRAERGDWPTAEHEAVLEEWLRRAAGAIVTTPGLAERLSGLCHQVVVVPNLLDERLLVRRRPEPIDTPFGLRPVTIGYMGTTTHGGDLEVALPALRRLAARHPGQVRLELVGVAARPELEARLAGMPYRLVAPKAAEREYAPFMVWFTATVRWDIAVSPILDTPFGRGKSDVKYLDYAAVAAAPVLADHPAYRAVVRHAETGMLCSAAEADWSAALEALVVDGGLRAAIADGAARYLWTERILRKRAHLLPDAVEQILGAA